MAKRLKKDEIREILISDNWRETFGDLVTQYGNRLAKSLFSNLYSQEPLVKWRSISAFGLLGKYLWEYDPMKARELVRKCIWMLTEESGGIAWGVPEVLGELLSIDEKLAAEYAHMLPSYALENVGGPDNYLDHLPLRRGIFWSIVRVAETFPQYLKQYKIPLIAGLQIETDPTIIYYLARACSMCEWQQAHPYLQKFLAAGEDIEIYIDDKVVTVYSTDAIRESIGHME